MARKQLDDGRAKLKDQHENGSHGVQVCAKLTDMLDSVLLDLYQSALDEIDDTDLQSHIALVPHGGFGRRDVAPFSDVDLMLLYDKAAQSRVEKFAATLSQQIVDSGLQLGFSSRTPAAATALGISDATIFTSLAESRFLVGSVKVFTRFFQRFRHRAIRNQRRLIEAIDNSRKSERAQFGETVYLLKPNLKRSRGGLRDVQMLRWIAFAKHGESDLDNLERAGHLGTKDRGRLRDAINFLLRLRNELHFHANRAQDVLDKGEQLRIAELREYAGWEGGLPVEAFMREYFEHTSQIRYISAHFLAAARQRKSIGYWLGTTFSQRIDEHTRMGPVHLSATKSGIERIKQKDLTYVMRLMALANRHTKRISHSTWQEIREAMLHGDIEVELTPEVASNFLELMSEPGRLAQVLRRLHELRVLEKIIPGMKHARCLLQFNEYHKYTVDEHTFRAIDHATNFPIDSSVGRAYSKIRDKKILHLALLFHDLGKGFPEDHSDVGMRIARDTCKRLGMSDSDREMIELLVQKHLLMAHLAFRRNIEDENIVLELAREVGSPVVLQMLYVLTAADLAAVGPDVLTDWKRQFLKQLYRKTRDYITGDTPAESEEEWLSIQQQELYKLLPDEEVDQWWRNHIESLPPNYIRSSLPRKIVSDLRRLRKLPDKEAIAWSRYWSDRDVVEYTVGARESIAEGVFHRLTGALSKTRHQIHSAEIHTLAGDVVLDRFFVTDQTFSGPPPEIRREEVEAALIQSITEADHEAPSFKQVWYGAQDNADRELSDMPTRIHFDNKTSEMFTVIDVFAKDRLGLLYEITRTLYELGLSVHVAKIGTYIDQVVDVFYVIKEDGGKIESPEEQNRIRSRLHTSIEGSARENHPVS